MKIALVVDHDINLLNGASYQSRQYIEWLVRNGHEVGVIHPSKRRTGPPRRDGVRFHPIPAFSVPAYREYCVPVPPLAVALWLKRWDVDIVHAETINPTLLVLAYWMRIRSRAPMFNVLTANVPLYSPTLLPKDNWAKKFAFRLGKAMMNWTSDRIEATFVLSDGMRDPLTRDFYSIDPAKVHTLTRPMAPARFAAPAGTPEAVDWGGVPRGRRLVTLSRLHSIKNVDFLVRTFAGHIYPRDRGLHFFIAGHGPLEGALRRLAEEVGCPNIHFLGRLAFDSVPVFLGGADYFLYASLSETFGNVVCEAKSMSVPVIALDDGGGVRSQIEDLKTGVLVVRHDGEEFASRFFELAADPGLQAVIRGNARLDAARNNDPERIYPNLMALYQKAIRGEPLDRGEIRRFFAYDRSFIAGLKSRPGENAPPSSGDPGGLRTSAEGLPV